MKSATAFSNADQVEPSSLDYRRNHPNSTWSPERTEALKQLFHQGHSTSQIAKLMGGGITRNAVIGRLHRIGLRRQAASSPKREAPRLKIVPTRPAPRAVCLVVIPPPPPPKPLPISRAKAFEPLPNSNPVIWTERAKGCCKWPVGLLEGREQMSCNERRAATGPYCEAHAAVSRSEFQPKDLGKARFARSLRRYVA